RQEESTNDMRSNEIILEDRINISNILFNEKNLTRLTVCNCRNLGCLFSSSIVSSFVRLQHLQIWGCPVLEEIIVVDDQEERNKNIVMFPQLQYLEMSNLEKLTSFCTGDVNIIEFPSLKELRISRCPKFMVKYKRITNDLMEKGQVFPSLEELSVDVKHIAAINKCQLFREDLLCKLKCLDVEFGDERTSILSLDDFLQRFHAMKVLKIVGECYVGESEEKVENGMEVIIREANKCCDLKHILKQESSNMNNLVILHVIRCNNLINLVPSSLSFQNLTTLKVSYCKGLMKVLTSSIAKSLVRLKEMRVSECNMITEIVLAVVDDAVDEIIVFSELKDLELCELKSMTSFCSGHCAFKFPSLERILVNDCPSMKIFSGGELSTPKLLKVQLDEFNKELWTWERDLNTTIQTLYLKTKVRIR
ncbi:hypothetical protein CISIN_1g0403321mg, partial [Citrus sinensis]